MAAASPSYGPGRDRPAIAAPGRPHAPVRHRGAFAAAWLILLLWGPAGAAETPVFDARFKETAVAGDGAGGEIAPVRAEGLVYADGLDGKCLRADTGTLAYPASVLPQDAGTLEVWVSPLPAGLAGGWYFFSGDAAEWGPEGVPRLWMWEGRPRFDVDGGGRLICAGLPPRSAWLPGTWHQLVGTWDRSGKVALYADGRLLTRKSVPPGRARSARGSPSAPAGPLKATAHSRPTPSSPGCASTTAC